MIDLAKLATQLVLDALHAAAARPAELRLLDRRREIDPAWFQRSRMIGYVCYADRFAGSLPGVREHLDYLAELGVTYLHLMPLLRPREGESDGGYAVADYDQVNPRVGTMADLQALAGDLHERGMVAVRRPGAQPHRAGARMGPQGGGRRARLPRDVPDLPGPDRTRRLRAHAARGVPRHRAGQLHPGPGPGLGVDELPRVPVGPELRQPGGVPGHAGHHARPGQPGHRRAPARRGAVPVEADGHRLPEPARGAPAAAGVPGADPAGRARPGAEGRGDRQPGAAGPLPRRP